jgi:integrase
VSIDAWVYQRSEQVRDMGAEAAPWYVGWYDDEQKRRKKSFGPGARGKEAADRYRRKVEAQLMAGTYRHDLRMSWEKFVEEYTSRVLDGLSPKSKQQYLLSLSHFGRIARPTRMLSVGAHTIADFVAARRKEPGQKEGDLVSPATVNRDLRHVKAALGMAKEWGYVHHVPKIRMEKEHQKLPRFVTGDHFALIYRACDQARVPSGLANVEPADWWRALLTFIYMTGWRIGATLALRRDCIDLDEGVAFSLADDNKGKRDQRVPLHETIVEHLRLIPSFDPMVFASTVGPRRIDEEFTCLQQRAGIKLPCRKNHKHSDECFAYGFHDLRRAFATYNADRLTPDALQALMQHKCYTTTQKYINLARQLTASVQSLHVPDVLKKAKPRPPAPGAC